MQLLLLNYLTMLTLHQVAFSFYWRNGVTPSDPRPFIGENLSLTCGASMRRKKNYSRYLYFEHNKTPVQPQYVHVINKRSIGLTLPILGLKDEGQFVCWYKTHKMPLTIGHQFVDVDYRPVKVEKIDCIVFNWQNMTCSWKLNRDYHYPKRIRATAFWRISQEQENGTMKACPSGNSNSSSCSWPSIIENYFFHPDVTYIIAVEVASTVRDVKETSELFVIDTRALVKPAPLESFRISQKNSTYLCLAWNHSDSHHSKMVEVQYKTDNSHWENQTTNGGQMCIGDLIPNTMYTLRGAVWPLVNYLPTGYPSEWINITEGTQQSALEVAPDMCDGCFTVLNISTSPCHVIIYWKHIPRELQYAELRGYQVHIENSIHVLQSYNRSKTSAFLCLNIFLDQSLTVTLLAMTDRTEWSLTYSTLILPAHTQQPASPEDFIVETDVAVTFHNNVTFYLKWTSPESDTDSYTVFWCLGCKKSKTCYENETLNWKHLPENITNYNLTITGKKDEYLVGLSRQVSRPGTKTLSSGISWSQCFYLRDIEPLKSPGKPAAKYTLSENSLLVWWSPLSCTESGSFIKHYVVYYSIANSTNLAESVQVDRTRHSVKLYSLQTGRRYAIQIAAASDKGVGAKSEIIFIDVPEGEDIYAEPHSFILIVCTVLGLSIGATVTTVCVCTLNDLFQEKMAKFAQNENHQILSHAAKTFTHSRNVKPSRQIYQSVSSVSRTTQSSGIPTLQGKSMKTLELAVLLALTFHCNGFESFNRQQPERDLQKRADDNPPLEDVVMQLSADLDRVQTQLTALQAKMDIQGRHAAFLAQYPSSMGPASGPYKFHPVVFNDGNGYDPATGIFTVPLTGTYLLAAQFFVKAHQTARPIWDMFCNGNVITSLGMLAAADSQAAGEESSSVPLIVKLRVGDRVWLEARNVAHDIWGDSNTFFAGTLLYSE